MKNIKRILLILIVQLFAINNMIAQGQIADRYMVQGGKGAETAPELIGSINDKVAIGYYLSCNVVPPEDIWMIHCLPSTDYEVSIPYAAKVLLKTFCGNIIELEAFTKDDGHTRKKLSVDKKIYMKYVSGVHCKVSHEQLELFLREGIQKIRIETTFPNGYIEREYNDMQLTKSLLNAYNLLINELKPVDIHEGF